MNLLNANEAYRKTSAISFTALSKDLEYVAGEIEKAVSQGRYSTTISRNLSSEIIKRLKTLGYNISIGQQYNDTFIYICWDEEK
jgi:hypothetical protein